MSGRQYLRATGLRYQARMVSGCATVATSARTFAAQTMTNLAERGSVGVREPQSTIQLSLQDAVFGGQIFVLRQQLLVHRPRDVGQDARPIHESPSPDHPRSAQSSVKKVADHPRRAYATRRLSA